MRILPLIALLLIAASLADPAWAQTASSNPYDVSWSALSPQNDWAAQVVQNLFPVTGPNGVPTGTGPGNEITVIGTIIGQFTGFIAAVACAFICYNLVMHIHRAAESSQILGKNQSWIFAVKFGFAAIMMFPLPNNGFSVGQQLVRQGALWGVGMARAVYNNAIDALGPDALVVAQPIIPGTANIVSALIDSEMCMDLVNLAGGSGNSNGQQLIPPPQPVNYNNSNGTYSPGNFVIWQYALSNGNQSGTAACGTVSFNVPPNQNTTIAGVNVNTTAAQESDLTHVITTDLRSQVAQVAYNYWTTRDASTLSDLQAVYESAVADYTTQLTKTAEKERQAINNALQKDAQQSSLARHGGFDLLGTNAIPGGTTSPLLTSEVQQSTLGWTSAGAYYLEIARLNAATLSLINNTPIITSPSFDGLGKALSSDLAPIEGAYNSYMASLRTMAATADGTAPPTGAPTTLGDQTNTSQNDNLISQIFNAIHISQPLLNFITGQLLPPSQWVDPFGSLITLGQTLINTSLAAWGTTMFLQSDAATAVTSVFSFLTGDEAGAAADLAGHFIAKGFALPIMAVLLAILIPGVIIAYVLPMIPYILWMAGVCGWLIIVCEALVGVPLWMLAHLTVSGDGLHGGGKQGWSLLFNVVFRPVLMILGLFLGYFIFAAMSFLVRESFGIAAGFALDGGWFVTNLIGLVVLLNIFVMLHVVLAIFSFRMALSLPHHLPVLANLGHASRIDETAFYTQAAWNSSEQLATGLRRVIATSAENNQAAKKEALSQGGAKAISSPGSGMDSTIQSTTDTNSGATENDDVRE
jgi:conjugal transfer/type IV secretion protein DotA/TraY